MSDAKSQERATVLFIDDEERILRALMMQFRGRYNVRGTTDPAQALEWLRNEHVHVIVSDQRMPMMYGHELLRRARQVSPQTMRLLLTGYSEMDAIVSSVNEGEIFRFIAKPWRAAELQKTVDEAAAIALATADVAESPRPIIPNGSAMQRFLVIDPDQATYEAVFHLIGEQHLVRWGATVEDAFEILSKQDTAVVISEVRVGDDDMAEAIKELKARHPDIVTIVLTSFRDTSTLIDLINQGQVFRFLPKPIRSGLLEKSLHSALEQHRALKSAPRLVQRHRVERPRAPVEARVSKGILGYLSRMRA